MIGMSVSAAASCSSSSSSSWSQACLASASELALSSSIAVSSSTTKPSKAKQKKEEQCRRKPRSHLPRSLLPVFRAMMQSHASSSSTLLSDPTSTIEPPTTLLSEPTTKKRKRLANFDDEENDDVVIITRSLTTTINNSSTPVNPINNNKTTQDQEEQKEEQEQKERQVKWAKIGDNSIPPSYSSSSSSSSSASSTTTTRTTPNTSQLQATQAQTTQQQQRQNDASSHASSSSSFLAPSTSTTESTTGVGEQVERQQIQRRFLSLKVMAAWTSGLSSSQEAKPIQAKDTIGMRAWLRKLVPNDDPLKCEAIIEVPAKEDKNKLFRMKLCVNWSTIFTRARALHLLPALPKDARPAFMNTLLEPVPVSEPTIDFDAMLTYRLFLHTMPEPDKEIAKTHPIRLFLYLDLKYLIDPLLRVSGINLEMPCFSSLLWFIRTVLGVHHIEWPTSSSSSSLSLLLLS